MNAPPTFPPNPDVGDWFWNWVWNGTAWIQAGGSGGLRLITQLFLSDGPTIYMPSPGLMSLEVECQGAGGGGGAVSTYTGGATAGYLCGGGGGAAGVHSRKVLPAALVLGGVIVTVGVAGVGGTGNVAGAPGMATSFGALCVAPGGNGGEPNAYNGPATPTTEWGRGGARLLYGDPSIIGDFGVAGCAGQAGGTVFYNPSVAGAVVWGGAGGASFWGAAGQQTVANSANIVTPTAHGEVGAGGSGGATGLNTTPGLGNRGGNGICLITEYCWGDTGDACCVPVCGSGQARVQIGSGGWNPYDGQG